MSVRYWPRRTWDRDAFDDLLDEYGTDEASVEREAHLHAGRFEELEDRGFDPYAHEVWRVAKVLGISMDQLFEETFPEA